MRPESAGGCLHVWWPSIQKYIQYQPINQLAHWLQISCIDSIIIIDVIGIILHVYTQIIIQKSLFMVMDNSITIYTCSLTGTTMENMSKTHWGSCRGSLAPLACACDCAAGACCTHITVVVSYVPLQLLHDPRSSLHYPASNVQPLNWKDKHDVLGWDIN